MAVNRHMASVKRYRLDRYGDRQLVDAFRIGECIIAPRSSSEGNDRSTTVTADAQLFVPAVAVIEPSDEIEVAGTVYQVDGEPVRWESPWGGWSPHLAVSLRRITG
ncbi:hypothetical protein [Amycolatopsis dendrobii]|uniref:Head-to-tail stopper n=1 Tax=Amycolatopsis dendrobii TaxID=2760662 RepID=A0A7W3VVE8_9PSEU|nr:hypothetical protein [Amycolatopsis dendrobii]MBB1153517.1 hypothetical protein [Amycolatopsis dendrobii]